MEFRSEIEIDLLHYVSPPFLRFSIKNIRLNYEIV